MRTSSIRLSSILLRPLIGGFAIIMLSACAGTFKHTVDFNPAEPIRIAVLPFAQVNEKGELVQTDENLLIDNVVIVSSKLKQTPAEFVQDLVQSELSKASLDVIIPAIVDAEFVHKGYTLPGNGAAKLDLKRVFAADPSSVCRDLLSCDAVLYGKVTKWDRSYYGVQTVATIGIDLKLVSANTKKILFESHAEDSVSRGITKGPTGLSSVVLEPIRGLDNTIVTDLAREIVSKAVAPLNARNRPEFLQAAPPALVASAHDASNGVIAPKGKLTVVALGTPGHTAFFSIGSAVETIPMVERRPGQYIGEYFPLASESFQKQPVSVSLRDQFGRTTTQKLTRINVTH
jgi:hypothetical protein